MSSLAHLPLQGEWGSPFFRHPVFWNFFMLSCDTFWIFIYCGFFFKLFTDLHKNKKKLVEVVWDMVVEFSPAFFFC